MNTREAIDTIDKYEIELPLGDAKKVIRLLQRGEKFEAIVEGFKEIFYKNPHNWVTKEYYADEIKKLEQKHFPKEVRNPL